MVDTAKNFTPLSFDKKGKRKFHFVLTNKVLFGLIGVLVVGIGITSALILLRKPITREVPAHVFGKIDKCGVIVGNTVSDNPSGMGKIPANDSDTYRVTYTIKNTTNQQ